MPAYFTHSYFALDLIDKLPYASCAVTRLYPDAYRLGALGADVLRSLGRVSAEMDVANPYTLFEQTGGHIYESGSKCQLSYMLGMLTHYLLDSRINPYIYYFAEHGVPHYFDDGKDMMSYEQIRSSIDHHIANAYLDGKRQEIMSFTVREDVLEDIAKLYERAIGGVLGHTLPQKQIQKALSSVEWTNWEGYRLTELDYLNRNHATWETVRNGSWTSTMSLFELLDKLQPIALQLIEDYMGRMRSGYALNRRAFQINHLGVMGQWE